MRHMSRSDEMQLVIGVAVGSQDLEYQKQYNLLLTVS